MRKIGQFTIVVVCIVMQMNIFAQVQNKNNWKTLSRFAKEEVLSFSIDFTNSLINGFEVDEFIAQESDWAEGVNDMNTRFSTAFNREAYRGTYPHRLTAKKYKNYTINVQVQQVQTSLFTKKRTWISVNITITDNNGDILFSTYIEESNGVFGTNLNLIGDALEAVGSRLGKMFFTFAVEV